MSNAPVTKVRPQCRLRVVRTSWISDHMVRVVLGGEEFAAFVPNGATDKYVKIHFPLPGVQYPEPMHVFAVRDLLPRELWPVTRTYTVRWIDPGAQELAIDFVVHGDEGLAGPWAASAQPGDTLIVTGPGGAYAPDPDADWHLFAGDESALPAIAASLEALPSDSRSIAFLETSTAAGMVPLSAPPGADIRWIFRGDAPAGSTSLLAVAVAAADWPAGRVSVFAHGERESMKALRNIFFEQRSLERRQVSLSGYWAYGRTEDRFQAEKKEPIGKIL